MTSKESECRLMLCHCLAIIMRKEGCQSDPGDFWMYESGYLLFQGLLAANSVCWWNHALQGAVKGLTYKGYVSPGALLVGSDPCALEVLRSAWARRVLQPPAGYQIVGLEEIEDFQVSKVTQTQWTPLTEAVCSVVLRLSSQGRPAGLESIRECLILAFPHVSPPTEEMIYDTLVQLMAERKLYNTSKGYFIVTPERRRSRSHSHGRKKTADGINGKQILMSNEEALIYVHGEIATIRDGDVTHQCIQTNLADVICGGNSSDKVIYPQTSKRRSASFPVQKSPDRRNSFKLWSSSRRLRRSASTRTIARNCTDSGSSTDYPNSSSDSAQTPKKQSLISRIFRRSKRSHSQMNSLNAQFPPTEWFNSKTIHLHCVGTQTSFGKNDELLTDTYKIPSSDLSFSRSATLPRRHRHISNDSEAVGSFPGSRDHSPKHSSPSRTSTLLPQNGLKVPSLRTIRKNSRSSLSPKTFTPVNGNSATDISDGQKHANESITDVTKASSAESIKTSHVRKNSRTLQRHDALDGSKDENEYDKFHLQAKSSDTKSSVSVDNSGPSSIESQKSERTGSSLTSGPSSLESNRTVIKKNTSTPLHSCRKTSTKSKESTPKRTPEHKAKLTQSNSFTLQVTTNQLAGNTKSGSKATTTATINSGSGTNAKIYVQNSPVRSVITFENGQNNDSNLVIISEKDLNTKTTQSQNGSENEEQEQDKSKRAFVKNTNSLQTKDENPNSLNNSKDLVIGSDQWKADIKNEAMNNNRKLSLQLSPKESLSYYNMIKNVSSSTNKKNSCNSNPESPKCNSFIPTGEIPSPTKSCDNISTFNDVFIRNMSESKSTHANNCMEKNILGSEPNISCKIQDYRDKGFTRELGQEQEFPSLTDLSFNFTSLAAQKILKGVSINSIDTLVELNTASSDKPNNYDVVHTDFGLV
ncbi:uncharacterized protein LOC108734146 [Agrilus planipennis]|uniref:Uncharacterized protein LOC108734146 n=1 Tax=Agrilus planipennis TaxID=224129 RepID=A0A1W4WAP7_AGRPL|nr:uncharacterized protein LOC108734146 [Agrilus planipennis]XP_018321067.1 uncharacterized protein LOC108734146 [Agrilus planipennis]XP_025834622.1 uncharacterized protein LOC108734146 [Agrilus planipennis]